MVAGFARQQKHLDVQVETFVAGSLLRLIPALLVQPERLLDSLLATEGVAHERLEDEPQRI